MMSPTSIACDGRITSQLGVPQGQRSAYLEPSKLEKSLYRPVQQEFEE